MKVERKIGEHDLLKSERKGQRGSEEVGVLRGKRVPIQLMYLQKIKTTERDGACPYNVLVKGD